MKLSRRNLLAKLSTLAGGLVAARLSAQKPGLETRIKNHLKRKQPVPAPFPFVYFGTDTSRGKSKGIYLSRFDPATGRLTPPTLAAACVRPSWFAIGFAGKRRILYVCNEGEGAPGTSSPPSSLSPPVPSAPSIASPPSPPAPVISPWTPPTSPSSLPITPAPPSPPTASSQTAPSPSPSSASTSRTPPSAIPAPNHARQDAPHPHCAILTPDDRFLLVNDLGNDNIVTFPVDAATAHLGPPHVHQRRAGSGPRHLAFHPNGRWIYCIDELDNHIDQLLLNTTRGDIAHGFPPQALLTDTGHSISTLDPHFHGTNTAAEIAVAPSGRFLYASNRGEDSLIVCTIDDTTGALTTIQRISCGGKAPRHFTLDPTGNWLICGNQDSATVTVFARNQGTGRLTGPVQTLPLDSVQFTLFA